MTYLRNRAAISDHWGALGDVLVRGVAGQRISSEGVEGAIGKPPPRRMNSLPQ